MIRTQAGIKFNLILLLFSLSFLLCAQSPEMEKILTPSEKEWLEKHPDMRLGVDSSSYFRGVMDNKGNYVGMGADYVRILERKTGVTFKPELSPTWSQNMEKAKSGAVDVIPIVAQTPEREVFLNFSDTIVEMPNVIITRKNNSDIRNIGDLSGKTVSINKDYAVHEWVSRNHPQIILRPKTDAKDGLKAVAIGEVDAYIGDLATAVYSINNLYLSDLKITSDIPFIVKWGIAVREDWPEFIPILNKAISRITPEENAAILNRWTTIHKGLEIKVVLVYAIPAIVAIVLLTLMLANIRLMKEVSRRKKTEEKLHVEMTRRGHAELYRILSIEILKILNEPSDLRDSMQRVLSVIKKHIGCDAVGIRLHSGDDFPYFVQNGFSSDFMLHENTLVAHAQNGGICRNGDGTVLLECTCGLVISGKTDPSNPLFTPGGSFWTNDSHPLLDLPPGADPRLNPRNRCIHEGYSSVALIPIRVTQKIVGLLHLNAIEKGRFTLDAIQSLELISSHIGEALVRKMEENEHRLDEARLESLHKISQFKAKSIQELLDLALEETITLTNSKIGYIYHYNEEKKKFVLNTWSKDVMKECTVANPQTCYQLDKTGIWGEAVRKRKPILLNDFPAQNPLKKGYPEGHAKLYKFLSIPVFVDDEIVAVAAVANKGTDYDQSDVRQLTLLMDTVWKYVERKETEAEKELLIKDLQKALSEVKVLSGLLPICASCKKIRDDKGYWANLESYLTKHTDTQFSHGICPDCAEALYPDLVAEMKKRDETNKN
ncbi:MAG: GAF domain-containing protein [Victivallales bacterium]